MNRRQLIVMLEPLGGGAIAALAISGTPEPNATLNAAYAGFTVGASGGVEPYVFSVASGALPTGITIDADTGEVSGTPTAGGSFADIVLRVTDAELTTADLAAFTMRVFTNAEATAYVERMTVDPSPARKARIDTLISSLKTGALSAANIFAKGDILKLYAAHDQQAANQNVLKDAHHSTLIADGATNPTWTEDEGYSGLTDIVRVSENYNPSTQGVTFLQDSASIALWNRTANPVNSDAVSVPDGTATITLRWEQTTDRFVFRINQTNLTTTANTTVGDGTGLLGANRSGAAATEPYRNGAVLAETGTGSANPNQASVARSISDLQIRDAMATGFEFAAFWIGGSLTANEWADLYNALNVYMTNLAAD